MSEKITITAPLIVTEIRDKKRIKEIASNLNLPDNSQLDLMFLSAIMVSTGTNKNGATFLGSELIKSRGSISQKALDVEHRESEIIGHIASAIFMDHEGNVIDDEQLYNELIVSSTNEDKSKASKAAARIDEVDMDIGVVCVVYKDRFPEISKEVEEGKWKVSMECYYDNFDVKIGNLIIPRIKASKVVPKEKSTQEDLKKVLAGKSLGSGVVSRVLRGIRFCGIGIVENPANERSIILEAASDNIKRTLEHEGIYSEVKEAAELLPSDMQTDDFQYTKFIQDRASDVVEVESSGFYLAKVKGEVIDLLTDTFDRDLNSITKEAVKRTKLDDDGSRYQIISANNLFIPRDQIELNESSEAITYHTNDFGDVEQIHSYQSKQVKEVSENTGFYAGGNPGQSRSIGPDDRPAGICVSFRKYLYEKPGLPNPGKIVATHWCKQFGRPCPVIGADAQDKACWRNRLSHLVKHDDLFGNQTIQVPFNPRVELEDTEFIDNDDLPHPSPGSAPGIEGMQSAPPLVINNSGSSNPASASSLVSISLIQSPIKIKTISLEERRNLKDKDFGLANSRKFPIHTEDKIKETMSLFNSVRSNLTKSEERELYSKVIIAALKNGVSTSEFESSSSGLAFRSGVDYSDEYGIPRLKLFPLNSRQQIIAAMSRFNKIKDANLTDREKDNLVVNILRACSKFNIDSTNFRNRIKKT